MCMWTLLLVAGNLMVTVIDGSSNVARGKSAYGSSTRRNNDAPSKAVDGSLSTYFHSRHDDTDPWWAVDLGTRMNVKEVSIINKHAGYWLHDFVIGVMNSQPTPRLFPFAYQVCHKHVGGIKSSKVNTFKCQQSIRGRYVVIQMPGRYSYLILTEVYVYAFPEQAGNVARGKKVWESSHYKGANRAGTAVDGSRANSGAAGQCSHTKMEADPWWVVDLGKSYSITKVIISNRGDCCHHRFRNVVVGVSNTAPVNSPPKPGAYPVCKAYVSRLTASQRVTLSCDVLMQGRYVVVQIPGQYRILELCEVEVYTYQ